jgi:hypothetical protein
VHDAPRHQTEEHGDEQRDNDEPLDERGRGTGRGHRAGGDEQHREQPERRGDLPPLLDLDVREG